MLVIGNILLAIPAIICGAIALRQIAQRGERGRGMAIAGLVLGILGILFFFLVLVVGLAVTVRTGSGAYGRLWQLGRLGGERVVGPRSDVSWVPGIGRPVCSGLRPRKP